MTVRPSVRVTRNAIGARIGRPRRGGAVEEDTGMGAAFGGMAVLGADRHAAGTGQGGRDQGEGWTDGDVDAAGGAGRIGNRVQFGELGDAAIHLPVADDELATDLHCSS